MSTGKKEKKKIDHSFWALMAFAMACLNARFIVGDGPAPWRIVNLLIFVFCTYYVAKKVCGGKVV